MIHYSIAISIYHTYQMYNASEKKKSTMGVRFTKTISQYDGTMIPKKNSVAGKVYE